MNAASETTGATSAQDDEPVLAGAITRYTDGVPRPLLRGILHTLVAALLPIAMAAIAIGYPDRWPLAVFIAGKECSYFSSALFHRWVGVGPSFPLHLIVRQVDKFSICISIAAAAVPTSFRTPLLFYSVSGGLLAGAAITNFTDMELSGGEGRFAASSSACS